MAGNGALEIKNEDDDDEDSEKGRLRGSANTQQPLLAPSWLHTFTDTLILGFTGMLLD